ncbi:MAG: ribosome maturation factor RimM [Hyphomicrobiaceae bacterium]
MTGERRVLLGRISGAHGIRGEIVVHAFTAQPEDVAAYGTLTDVHGDGPLSLRVVRVTDKGVIARIAGISDRTAAEGLKGRELWVERSRLPDTGEGEYYHADLIGLAAVSPSGETIGTVVALPNYGAGDLLEIRLEGSRNTELVPFSDAFVPEVDVANGRVVVRMPSSAPDDDEG